MSYEIVNRIKMKNLAIVLILSLAVSPAFGQFGKLLDKAKNSDIGKKADSFLSEDGDLDIAGGLKEALQLGVDEAVVRLSSENGYLESPYKILLPEEAQTVADKLKMVPGFNNVERDLIQKMNEAAELAARKATPIFTDAITSMSFTDAKNILMGEDNAATEYLQKTSRQKLYDAFLPEIQKALDTVNARTYWRSVVEKYNSLPFTSDVNPELDDHVNNKSLDGLFSLVEVKEKGIREDVSQRTSPLLKDVFSKLDSDK